MSLFNKKGNVSMENQLILCGFTVSTTKLIDPETDKIVTVSEAYKTVNVQNTVITEENGLGKLSGETIWIRFEFNNNFAICGLDTPNINKNNLNPIAMASYIDKLKTMYKHLLSVGVISNTDYKCLCNFELGYKIPIENKSLSKMKSYENNLDNIDA